MEPAHVSVFLYLADENLQLPLDGTPIHRWWKTELASGRKAEMLQLPQLYPPNYITN